MAESLKSEKKPKISGVILVAAPEGGIDSLTRIFADLPAALDLRASLLKAATERTTVKTEKIVTGLNDDRLGVSIIVEPLLNNPGERQAFVVFLQDAEIAEGEKIDDSVKPSVSRDEHVQRIESQLRLTRERLQATIEELESSYLNMHARKMAENRQILLLAELQHRVKNILAVVRSLANRTAENAETLEDFVAHFDGRLSAMGRTQNILARTAEGGVDLTELVHEEFVGHAAHFDDQVEVSGPEIKLRAKPAEILGLAIHELATNAVKYGALSTRSGHIRVSWRVDERVGDPRLTFEWLESGVPVIDREPARSGFGRELIERGLPYDLRANTALEFRQGGVRCVIELPLDDKTAIREKED